MIIRRSNVSNAAAAVAARSLIDSLETRCHLSAATISGSAGADRIDVLVYQGNIYGVVNGVTTTYLDATYDGIVVNGGGGNDTIFLDSNGDNATTVDGGSGVDLLNIGTKLHDTTAIESPVVANSSDGVDSLVLDDGSAGFGDDYDVYASGLFARDFFGGVTQTGFADVVLNTGDQDDLVVVHGTPTTGTYHILGGDGVDQIKVNSAQGATVIVDGGDGDDFLDVNNDTTPNGVGATVTLTSTQQFNSILEGLGGNLVVTGTAGVVITTLNSNFDGSISLDRGFFVERNSESIGGSNYYRDRLRLGANNPVPTDQPTFFSSFAKSSAIDDALAYGYQEETGLTSIGGIALNSGDLVIRYDRRGDANMDGTVDFADLLTLAKNYGTAGDRAWTRGDFDLDGQTGFSDLLSLAKNYGQNVANPAAAAAPVAAAAAAVTRKQSLASDVIA